MVREPIEFANGAPNRVGGGGSNTKPNFFLTCISCDTRADYVKDL